MTNNITILKLFRIIKTKLDKVYCFTKRVGVYCFISKNCINVNSTKTILQSKRNIVLFYIIAYLNLILFEVLVVVAVMVRVYQVINSSTGIVFRKRIKHIKAKLSFST